MQKDRQTSEEDKYGVIMRVVHIEDPKVPVIVKSRSMTSMQKTPKTAECPSQASFCP
jgi:hypothetical protein